MTLLYGSPGVGKSLLLLQLLAAATLGRTWLGLPVERSRVIAIFCEDDADELHRRIHWIARAAGVNLSEFSQARWLTRVGEENLLATFTPEGVLRVTPLFQHIEAYALSYRPDLIILDNAAQMLGGNENDRSIVTQFCNLLSGLALRIGAAVVLAGHPSKSLGSEYSGSTAWDAACRSRLLLERPPHDQDAPQEGWSDLRVLRRAKANYASTGDTIALHWDAGLFHADQHTLGNVVDRIEAGNREKAAEQKFLELLDRLRVQGRAVSHTKTATNYAPKVMAHSPDISPFTKVDLTKAMERLFDKGEIAANEVVGSRPNRHPLIGIARVRPRPERFSSHQQGGAPSTAPPSYVVGGTQVSAASAQSNQALTYSEDAA